jgi:hypothetical protein
VSSETVVYGYIKNVCEKLEGPYCRDLNYGITSTLPDLDEGDHLSHQMFSLAVEQKLSTQESSYLIPFGACYVGIEYEWRSWLKAFETLLSKMYWSSAVVHIDTEFNGNHIFSWDFLGKQHVPGASIADAKLDWVHDQV